MSTDVPRQEIKRRSSQLIDRIWTLQDRISELREFEKQWDAIFQLLKAKSGQDRRVNVLNFGAYRSFRWDRYHALMSDLMSFLETQLKAFDSLALVEPLLIRAREIQYHFNLKFEEVAQLQYLQSDERIRLDETEDVVARIFEIFSDNSAWVTQATSARNDFSHITSISDQIDLILFGTIRSARERFYSQAEANDPYWEAREKFFSSDAFHEFSSNWNASK